MAQTRGNKETVANTTRTYEHFSKGPAGGRANCENFVPGGLPDKWLSADTERDPS